MKQLFVYFLSVSSSEIQQEQENNKFTVNAFFDHNQNLNVSSQNAIWIISCKMKSQAQPPQISEFW